MKKDYMKNGEIREGNSLSFDGKGFTTNNDEPKKPSRFWCFFGLHRWSYELTGGSSPTDYMRYGVGTCDACEKKDTSKVGTLFRFN